MATIRNLSEGQLYAKLPAGILSLDEKGILRAICSGFQDRYEDLRAHAKGLQRLLEPGALPQTGPNAVFVELVSPQGKNFTRSLDINDTTPPTEGTGLAAWAAVQLGLEAATLSNVRFGIDPLRLIEAPILENLAATVGCILYTSSALASAEAVQAREDLVKTWFPRLKIKGTPRSFDALGRILGFDDIRFTPLYGRLSPRDPSDVGAAANDPDFAAVPELIPQQTIGPLYNPNAMDSGPFFSWAGTANSGTSATDFYTQAINGFNPWIDVLVLDVAHGTVVHPSAGSYALGSSGSQSEGGPHKKAYVDPPGSTVRFRAIAEGDSFNGLEVHVIDLNDPARKVIQVDDRLSAIQYRSSYFDLGMAVSFERAGEVFGDQAMRTNPDLSANPVLVAGGTATSPYRPWSSGSVAVQQTHLDWVVQSGAQTGVTIARTQALASARQENIEALVQAGAQVTAAMEEVRPATRHLRRASVGYQSSGSVPYAAYHCREVLFTTAAGTSVYSGASGAHPLGSYAAAISVENYATWDLTIANTLAGEIYTAHVRASPVYQMIPDGWLAAVGSDSAGGFSAGTPLLPAPMVVSTGGNVVISVPRPYTATTNVVVYKIPGFVHVFPSLTAAGFTDLIPAAETDPTQDGLTHFKQPAFFSGSYSTLDHGYRFSFAGLSANTDVVAHYTVLDSGTVRPEPAYVEKFAGTHCHQARPEDDLDDPLINEVYDEYPWRRDLVGGGELIELDAYTGTNEAGRDLVAESMALPDHTGAEYNLYGYQSSGSSRLRLAAEPRDTGENYAPGQVAIAFSGNFRDLSALTANQTELLVNPHDPANLRTQFSVTDMDRVFEAGWALYHAGLVQGIPVADPVGFFGTHHYDGLTHWLPFNEHPADYLVVRNAASNTSVETVVGVMPADRLFDPVHGPCLRLRPGSLIESRDDALEIAERYTISFWVNVGPPVASSAEIEFLRFGPLTMDYIGDNTVVAVTIYTDGTNTPRQMVGGVAIDPVNFGFIYATVEPDRVTYGVAAIDSSISALNTAVLSRPLTESDRLSLAGGPRGLRIRDLRMWNKVKTPAELVRIAQHRPTPTATLYRPAWFNTAAGDRYGLRVLRTGWLEASALPPWLRTPKLARIRRYDSLGRYEGEPRFKETGLGGGRELPATWQLGRQLHNLTAEGEVVYSGTHGALPGVDQVWLDDTNPGTFTILNTGSTSTGTVAGFVSSGTSSPWPNLMAQTNPLREFIWVKGDDGGVHEITLGSSGAASAVLNAASLPIFQAGAEVRLESAGTHLAVGTGGTVYQGQFSGTDTTPPLYMCLNMRTVEDATNPWARWTEAGDTRLFGNQQVPPLAALDENGVLEFANTASLAAGNYRLTIESGNLGRTDPDFDGFAVEIRIDTVILSKRLCRGLSGHNVRGSDIFEFVLPGAVSGDWILSIEWTGAFADENTGTARRLAVYSYKLERIATEAWKVTIAPSGSLPLLTQLTTTSFAGTTPGGWLAQINSYGSVIGYRHESQVYPSNDTLTGKVPLSNLLGATTEARREDIILVGDIVLADSGSYAIGAAGSVAPADPSIPVLTLDPDSGSNSIMVKWSQASVPESNEVWRNVNDGGFVLATTVAGATIQWIDTGGMASGDVWCYKVRGVNGALDGDFSNVGCAVKDKVYLGAGAVAYPTWMLAFGDLNSDDSTLITSLDFSGLLAVKGSFPLDNTVVLASLSLMSSLALVGGNFTFASSELTGALNLPALSLVDGDLIFTFCALSSLSFPALTTVNGDIRCDNCANMTSIVFPNLVLQNGRNYYFDSCPLSVVTIEHILSRAIASGVSSANITLDSNPAGHGLSDLSAGAQANYATLTGLGNTILIDP